MDSCPHLQPGELGEHRGPVCPVWEGGQLHNQFVHPLFPWWIESKDRCPIIFIEQKRVIPENLFVLRRKTVILWLI